VAVLLINAVIGFLMEWQAGQALEALRGRARSMARVRRAGREAAIDAGGAGAGRRGDSAPG
jgi:magnesium-transporting ATPase (P-type)